MDRFKSSKPNLKIDLPLDIEVVKLYDELEIKKVTKNESYKYEINGEVKFELGMIRVLKETKLTNNYVCHLNSSANE